MAGLVGSTAQGQGSLPLQGSGFVAGDGADPDSITSGAGSHWNVLNWGPGAPAAVPASYSINKVDGTGRTTRKILVSTQSNPDVASAASEVNLSTSEDSGLTFLHTERDQPATALNMTRMPDGSLLQIDFIPEWNAEHTGVDLLVRTSTDDGEHWKLQRAPVAMPEDHQLGPTPNGLRVHRRVLVLPGGTLIVPAYGTFVGERTSSSFVLQSSDGGETWSLRSVIPTADLGGSNEVGWTFTADNRLLAVLRGTVGGSPELFRSVSEDNGRTWTTARKLIGPDGAVLHGIYPDLVLQPNGTLLLATGRPDVRVLTSNDGTGEHWDSARTIFANYPSTGNNGRYDGTSGNTSMENVGAGRSIIFYDQCHVWGCGAYDEQFGVSASYVAAVTPGVGLIDVASKLIDKSASVSGSFAAPDRRFPEQRPAAAFDGSSAVGSEAVLVPRGSRPGTMVLKLDRSYPINRIGLMLGHGDAESADVAVSADGSNWKTVNRVRDRQDRAMRYTDVTASDVGYLKITGAKDRPTKITELQLYAAGIDTFENELPFAVPRGWTDAEHAWVTDVAADPAYSEFGGDHSRTALRLWDKWTDDNARITRPSPATDHQRASMSLGQTDTRAPLTIGVRGTAGGKPVTAWNFRLKAGTGSAPQQLEVNNGTGWVGLGALDEAIPLRTYRPVSIDATTDRATITIGSQTFETTTTMNAADQLAGLTFSTDEPAGYGGIYYLDNLSITG
ncbi:exo-alpha-sialidase [Microlunatus soli]|nr:exo-alpha-sialidase [Microlunatus soli]